MTSTVIQAYSYQGTKYKLTSTVWDSQKRERKGKGLTNYVNWG